MDSASGSSWVFDPKAMIRNYNACAVQQTASKQYLHLVRPGQYKCKGTKQFWIISKGLLCFFLRQRNNYLTRRLPYCQSPTRPTSGPGEELMDCPILPLYPPPISRPGGVTSAPWAALPSFDKEFHDMRNPAVTQQMEAFVPDSSVTLLLQPSNIEVRA